MDEIKYGIIYTDPPWEQSKGGAKSVRKNSSGVPLDYPTLSMDEIFKIHEPFFRQADKKHNVFMWTIDKYLPETERRMHEAGYTLHARIVWNKITGIPAAYTVRFAHEYLLWFYRKGNMLMPTAEQRGKWSTVITEQVKRHSQKPEIAYQMIESMFPDSAKIELFARTKRTGWDSFGNEVKENE